MIDAGIDDGDLIVVEPVADADVRNGEIVAARIDGESAVKRYFKAADGQIVLEPANPNYPPIMVHEHEDFTVLGRVTSLFRHLEKQGSSAPSHDRALAHA
jgi:repressor LexA